MSEATTTTTAPAVEPAVTTTAAVEKPAEKTYTAEQVERRLQGQGKALAALQAERDKLLEEKAEAEKEKLEAAGKLSEALGLTKKELAAQKKESSETAAKLAAYEAKEQARLEAIAKDNKAKIKALPEALQSFPLPEDPELAAAQLAILAGGVSTSAPHPRVKANPPQGGGNNNARSVEQGQSRINDLMMGRLPEKGDK